MKILPSSRVLLLGDSVTDCGRARPVGEAPDGLGDGYVRMVDALLRTIHPTHDLTVLNLGVSGDTVRDLAARWDRDVIALQPDWLTVLIGINDVWRVFHEVPERRVEAVPADEFERTYDALLARTKPQLRGLVLLTPFHLQPDRADPMRSRMDVHGAVVRRLAARHGAELVDLQAVFDAALRKHDYRELAGDRVHPTELGHGLIARALLGALEAL